MDGFPLSCHRYVGLNYELNSPALFPILHLKAQPVMVSKNQEFWLRLLFKVKLYETSGDAFQGLFSQLMELSTPGFQSIVPWGDWGDGGNDGWIEESGHYFQVYGPKPTTKDSETVALGKAINDFEKLPKKWQNVRRYFFVMNDRFCGIPAPIASALQQLKINKGLDEAGAKGCKDLMHLFIGLDEGIRQDIIPGVPPDRPGFVDSRFIGDLLSNLANNTSPSFHFLSEPAPDFDEKIKLNGLTPPISDLLRAYFWQSSVVDEFLRSRDPGLQQAIAEEIRDLYKKSKAAIPEGDEDAPNARYVWLIEQLIPPSAHLHPHTLSAYRTAAQIVLSKYFESCDAYEHPSSIVATQAYALQ